MRIDSKSTLEQLQRFTNGLDRDEDLLLQVVNAPDGRTYVRSVTRNTMSYWQKFLSHFGLSSFNLDKVLNVLKNIEVGDEDKGIFDRTTMTLYQKVRKAHSANLEQKRVVDKIGRINALDELMIAGDKESGQARADARLFMVEPERFNIDQLRENFVQGRLTRSYLSKLAAASGNNAQKIKLRRLLAEQSVLPNTLMRLDSTPQTGLLANHIELNSSHVRNGAMQATFRKMDNGSIVPSFSCRLNASTSKYLPEGLESYVQELSTQLTRAGFCKGVSVSKSRLKFPARIDGAKEAIYSESKGLEMHWPDVIEAKEEFGKKIDFEGVGSIFLGGKNPCISTNLVGNGGYEKKSIKEVGMHDRVYIELAPCKTKEEALVNMKMMLSSVGLDAVLTDRTEDDVEKEKAMFLLHLFFPEQAYAVNQNLLQLSPERLREAIVKKVPEMKTLFSQHLDRLQHEEILPGKKVFVLPGFSYQIQEKGAYGLMMGMYARDDIGKKITSMLTHGALSSIDRYENGLFVRGGSTSHDIARGGADNVFTRMITPTLCEKPIIYFDFAGEVQILIDLSVLDRGGYGYAADLFGSKSPEVYPMRGNLVDFAHKGLNNRNEVMVKHAIHPKYFKKILVDSEETRKKIVDELVAKGLVVREGFVTSLLGKARDRFVPNLFGGANVSSVIQVVGSTSSAHFKREMWE